MRIKASQLRAMVQTSTRQPSLIATISASCRILFSKCNNSFTSCSSGACRLNRDGDEVLRSASLPSRFLRGLLVVFFVEYPLVSREACGDFFFLKPYIGAEFSTVCVDAARGSC